MPILPADPITGTPGGSELLLRGVVLEPAPPPPAALLPEARLITLGPGLTGAFSRRQSAVALQPALQMLMMATCGGYQLGGRFGADRLLLVSAGTGHPGLKVPPDECGNCPPCRLAARSRALWTEPMPRRQPSSAAAAGITDNFTLLA